MKTNYLLSICLGLLILAGSAAAQSGFDTFWKKFKTAVERSDKPAVVAMTKLPFSLGYDPSAKGGEAFLRTQKSFLKKWTYIFNGDVDAVKCFAKAVPEKEKTGYAVACSFKSEPDDREKPLIYTFKNTKQGWRFAGFENINE